jgi:coenzyme Q-binding protein COQ10
MPHFRDDRIVPYSPQHLYDLVLDIEKYPEFLPWCVDTKILEKSDTKLYASMTAGIHLISATCVCKVTSEPGRSIRTDYIDGPFKRLHNEWLFLPHPEGCDIRFYVDFEFSTGILNRLSQYLLIEVTEKMVEAFLKRAESLEKGGS